LSLDGSQLIFSRIISGSGFDSGNAIALDSQHFVWVTGMTSGTFLVGTPANNALAQVQGPSDIFYRKFDSVGNWLFSGLLGGSGDDIGAAVAIDPDNNPWFTGQTCSTDFPATPGYDYLKGRCGVFVLRLTNQPEIGTIESAMVFGGSDVGDGGTGIAVNANREAYITGYTHSSLFPVTANAYQTVPIWSAVDQAFVMKLDGLHWIYSTFLGGNDGDTFGYTIALNAEGEVYVGADTNSTFFRTQPTPSQPIAALCKFSPDLSTLLSMTFLGDAVRGITVLEGPPAVSGPVIYTGGSFNTGDNIQALMERVRDEIPTTTTLISAPNPSPAATYVTLEASVNSAVGLPQGGQVRFFDDGATIGTATLSKGSAMIKIPLNAVGSYHFRAEYLTDGKFASSISNIDIHTVAHPTKLTLTSSANPSSANQSVTFTAKITTDTENVTGSILLFRKNGHLMSPSIIGSGALSRNVARITISNLPVGDNVITAVFEGSPGYVPSQAPPLTQTVKPASTTTLTSSLNPSSTGQTVKFTAKVTATLGGTPTGTVTFKNGTSTLGKAALSRGRATFSTSKIGSGQHTISAIYSGDAKDAPSSRTMKQTVK
jgi:Big-like domain-containing protein